jgi:hypothetical protein
MLLMFCRLQALCVTQDHYDDQHHNQHPSHEEVGHFLQQIKGPRRSFPNKLIAPRVLLGQIYANHVHGNNSCHDASKKASIAATRAPSSKALQFSAGIPKRKAHSVSWKSIFFCFSLKYYGFAKAFNVHDKLIRSQDPRLQHKVKLRKDFGLLLKQSLD